MIVCKPTYGPQYLYIMNKLWDVTFYVPAGPHLLNIETVDEEALRVLRTVTKIFSAKSINMEIGKTRGSKSRRFEVPSHHMIAWKRHTAFCHKSRLPKWRLATSSRPQPKLLVSSQNVADNHAEPTAIWRDAMASTGRSISYRTASGCETAGY